MASSRSSRKPKLGPRAGNPRRHSTTAYKGQRRSHLTDHSATERRTHTRRRRH